MGTLSRSRKQLQIGWFLLRSIARDYLSACAISDLTNRVGSHIREKRKLLTWYPVTFRLVPHPVVAPFHQPLFQAYRILYEFILIQSLTPSFVVRLDSCYLQAFQQGMETSIISLTEQQQQVQARDLRSLIPWRQAFLLGGEGVEWLELLVVSCEGGRGSRVLKADRDEGTEFENVLCGLEEVRRGCGGRNEGVFAQEGELGVPEEVGAGFMIGCGVIMLKLVDN